MLVRWTARSRFYVVAWQLRAALPSNEPNVAIACDPFFVRPFFCATNKCVRYILHKGPTIVVVVVVFLLLLFEPIFAAIKDCCCPTCFLPTNKQIMVLCDFVLVCHSR
jgi:hypothetical protein